MKKNYQFPKKTIKDLELRHKRVLLRADFNVPLDEDGKIDSDFRIQSTLETIEYLVKKQAEVVILAHLGRPKGRYNKSLSLEPVAERLSVLLEQPVGFVEDCIGDKVTQALKTRQPGKVTVLENVRFYSGEEENDSKFAKQLIESTQPDYVVQDGFGVIHRAHASTEGISHIKPAVAGLLLEKEVTKLSEAIEDPNLPLVAIIGGAKVADKLPLIERFLKQADTVLVGGALANTFFSCKGIAIGKSVCEPDHEAEIKKILKKAKPGQVVLPVDAAVSKEVNEHSGRSNVHLDHVASGEYILDIGPVSEDLFTSYIEKAGTVIWNGTMGYAENPRFAKGSAALAKAMSDSYRNTESIIGGGDTADFVLEWQKQNAGSKFHHISTGGGASLELLSGKKLPGVEVLLSS
jgi:phosphoglycerate kinase